MIEIQNLKKTYRLGDVDVHALRGVSLKVERGEFVSIIGPSGSGKSTLFHILGGLTPPTSGTVHIDGRDLLGMTDAERTNLRKTSVGFVFQKYNLLPTLSAADNIAIAQNIAGRPAGFDSQFEEILGLLGLKGRLHHKPRALSGGEQQRVALARAFMGKPPLLMADEPTGNLDTTNGAHVLDLLLTLNKQEGTTLVLVTHDPALAARADRLVMLRDGVVISDEVRA